MGAAKKAPSLAVVISEAKASKKDDVEADDGAYSAAVDELAEHLGVSEEKYADFAEAFRAAVMSCK